jgi:hypothetical protein
MPPTLALRTMLLTMTQATLMILAILIAVRKVSINLLDEPHVLMKKRYGKEQTFL